MELLKKIKANFCIVGMLCGIAFVVSLFFMPLVEHWWLYDTFMDLIILSQIWPLTMVTKV